MRLPAALCSLLILSLPALAQTNPCLGAPDLRAAIHRFEQSTRTVPTAEKRTQLEALRRQFPDEFLIERLYLYLLRWGYPTELDSFRDSLVARAVAEPENAFALTLAANALIGESTPRAVELAHRAAKLNFPWAELALADIYTRGTFTNKQKSNAHFAAFAAACDGYIPDHARYLMGRAASAETQSFVARRLREMLASSTDPQFLLNYEFLWGLEFRTTPAAGHPALRQRIAQDLQRLESLDLPLSAPLLALFKSAATQSSAPPDKLKSLDDRLTKAFPTSQQAYRIAYDAWAKSNKEPEDHNDKAAWDRWNRSFFNFAKTAAAQYTEAEWLPDSLASHALAAALVSEDEALALLRPVVASNASRNPAAAWPYLVAASQLLERGLAPRQALLWARLAWDRALTERGDNHPEDTWTEEQKSNMLGSWGDRYYPAHILLQALIANQENTVPAALRAIVEQPLHPALKPARRAAYLHTRARLARLDDKPASALAYYQAALRERPDSPKPWRGILQDELLAEAESYFLSQGGTGETFALWSAVPPPKEASKEGRWDKPAKDLPAFELPSLSGQTYKLKQLEGKALLINLWATWCGPCRAELPKLQKLYEQTKSRQDVQVLTFNIDEDLGLVEPYMKENAYSFPVLFAYSLTRELLEGIGIPQNWIVSPQGKWLWTQMGFDGSDPDWVRTMIAKLEAAKSGQ